MSKVNIKELKPGNTFLVDNELYACISNELNKQARAAGKYGVKMKHVKTGSITETTYTSNATVEVVTIDKNKMTYSYSTGDTFCFMDNNTYEQIELPASRLEWEKNFLVEGNEVEITSYEGEVLGVALPVNVEFDIIEAEPAVKGDTATGATKFATIETGFQIKVPLFIETGDRVVVSTVEGKYAGRA